MDNPWESEEFWHWLGTRSEIARFRLLFEMMQREKVRIRPQGNYVTQDILPSGIPTAEDCSPVKYLKPRESRIAHRFVG